MSARRATVTVDNAANRATLQVTVHANDRHCEVSMTVSPIPGNAADWADVAEAISDLRSSTRSTSSSSLPRGDGSAAEAAEPGSAYGSILGEI
jgi:surface antigen